MRRMLLVLPFEFDTVAVEAVEVMSKLQMVTIEKWQRINTLIERTNEQNECETTLLVGAGAGMDELKYLYVERVSGLRRSRVVILLHRMKQEGIPELRESHSVRTAECNPEL